MGHLQILEMISVRVTPDDDPSASGILVDDLLSLPFTLEREWSGNQGYYFEHFTITMGDREVYRSVPQQIFVRGVQSSTAFRDHIDERIPLEPGICHMVFHIDDDPMVNVELQVKALAPA